MPIPLEIERKFIIKKPDTEKMSQMPEYDKTAITQIYLLSDGGITHRIRSRKYRDRAVYTETVKKRIDEISVYEDEREIGGEEFLALSKKIDKTTRPISKVRHSFLYSGKTVEIDIYPEWKNTAIMEIELESRDDDISLPEFISVVREVSGIKEYSNASMSRRFPDEEKSV